jgi:predicted nucleotidyltransferase
MKQLAELNKDQTIQLIGEKFMQRNEVEAAYLFGSFPNEEVYNDIDILVLFNPYYDSQFSEFELVHLLSETLNIQSDKIDLIPFDLTKVSPLILYRAIDEGILIKDTKSALLGDQIEALSQFFLENEPCLHYRNIYLKELYAND